MPRHFKPHSVQMSFGQHYIDAVASKRRFYVELNKVMNWESLRQQLLEIYPVGKRARGQKAYEPLLLFKMLLVGQWHKLSDRELELYVWDTLSARHFCGLAMEDPVPDHSTLSRFRTRLVALGAWDGLLETVNDQLRTRGMAVTEGAIVDASLTESPYAPKGGGRVVVTEDRMERRREDVRDEAVYHATKRQTHPNADHDGRWVKKRNQTIYGYKKHVATDEAGMILAVHTTPANEHDSKGLVPLIQKVRTQHRQEVLADKGYKSKANDEFLAVHGSRSRIMHKGYRNRPMNADQLAENREISRKRWVVERTFGSLKRWFGSGSTQLKGLQKVHAEHVIEAIAHNLKRFPGIAMSLG
ncbi:MAG: IS5 family transposase [Rhodothermaceae bacterium]|nr:IS5 family transposase [Rhodothermaceae bacterium]MXW33087.1 IS5 family transposase [Rhodothermaceae bacterium]MXZ17618.1 IS5 family transposase [Rhodothermaceae bacterium]MYC05166.1 IS5 family transposase [Rhodothermaceae bacterium]MYE63871.1 IS5 family transposase [Rhodothermaceae bacterium]